MEKIWWNYGAVGLLVAFLFIIPVTYSGGHLGTQTVYKNIALYPSIVPAIRALEHSLVYQWTVENVHYQLNVTMITRWEAEGRGAEPLTCDTYDVFVIGASARQYLHGMNAKWKENVKKFIQEGGGYVGICGGANEASLGVPDPSGVIDRIISSGSLGVANVYINDDQEEEWQFLYKSSGIESGVPLDCLLMDHPIMAVSPDDHRVIRYEGGPGLYLGDGKDPLLGEIIPLAIYAEEAVEKAPIHFWVEQGGEWVIERPVHSDIKGQYAAVTTTYGAGRVVLFGPHPEEYTILGGHVEEFLGRTKYTLFRDGYLYRWVDGNDANWSYNWWMVRRSAAWAAGIPDAHLPPLDGDGGLSVSLDSRRE